MNQVGYPPKYSSSRQMSGDNHRYGVTIVIQHQDNLYTLYAHLRAIRKGIKIGSKVKKGDPIGLMGGSYYGNPYGVSDHLHFEVRNHDPSKIDLFPWGYYPRTDALNYNDNTYANEINRIENEGDFKRNKMVKVKKVNDIDLVIYDPKEYIPREPTKIMYLDNRNIQTNINENEPNNSTNEANTIQKSIKGIINPSGDIDFFKFDGKEGEKAGLIQ